MPPAYQKEVQSSNPSWYGRMVRSLNLFGRWHDVGPNPGHDRHAEPAPGPGAPGGVAAGCGGPARHRLGLPAVHADAARLPPDTRPDDRDTRGAVRRVRARSDP